ncbi:MAG: hypothetical protein WA790_13950 [Sulfitobacter sp.]
MKLVVIVCASLAVAACGADGEPIYPTVNNDVTLSNSGISANTNLALRQGPLTVSLGVGL